MKSAFDMTRAERAKYDNIHKLPKYKSYRQFVFDQKCCPCCDDCDNYFLNEDKLLAMLEGLEWLFPESFVMFFETFRDSATVNMQAYNRASGIRYVDYVGEATEDFAAAESRIHIRVAYSHDRCVDSWTFVPDDHEPMKIRADVESHGKTTYPEVVYNSICLQNEFYLYVSSSADETALRMEACYDEGAPDITDLQWLPFGSDLFSFKLMVDDPQRELPLKILKTFMQEGVSAAFELTDEWSAKWCGPEESFDVVRTLIGGYRRIKREKSERYEEWLSIMYRCGFPNTVSECRELMVEIKGKNREDMMERLFYKAGEKLFGDNKEAAKDAKLILQYLTMFKHRAARELLAKECKVDIPEDFGLHEFWYEGNRCYKK